MKKFLSISLAIVLALSLSVPAFASVAYGFDDSDAYPIVAEAARRGLVRGTGNGKFQPLSTLTRAEFATMLYRYAIAEDWPGAHLPYSGMGQWYDGGVAYLRYETVQRHRASNPLGNAEIVAAFYGTDESDPFRPGDPASYVWMVQMLYLMAVANGMDLPISDLEENALSWAADIGYGPTDATWRQVSSGDFVARFEGLELLIGLGDYVTRATTKPLNCPPVPPQPIVAPKPLSPLPVPAEPTIESKLVGTPVESNNG